MASVTLKNVSKTYENGQEAVREASFTVNDGEFMVLVGPSGCDKSTTLRMLAGLESVTAGTIAIDGDVVNDMPPKDRDWPWYSRTMRSTLICPSLTTWPLA